MFVIGVAGQAQMGKDTLADRLQEKLNEAGGQWQRTAFAANVKKVYCDTFGVDLDFVEKWKTVPESPPGFDMTVRQSLQFIGDGFRKIQASIWLDLAFRDKASPKIISDVRYINEFRRVKAEGGLNILVGRPDKINDDPNGSEAQIRPYIDWCLKNFERCRFYDLRAYWNSHRTLNSDVPAQAVDFDVFVQNNGTKEELYELIDTVLVPYVQKYTFDCSDVEIEKEEPCLIFN